MLDFACAVLRPSVYRKPIFLLRFFDSLHTVMQRLCLGQPFWCRYKATQGTKKKTWSADSVRRHDAGEEQVDFGGKPRFSKQWRTSGERGDNSLSLLQGVCKVSLFSSLMCFVQTTTRWFFMTMLTNWTQSKTNSLTASCKLVLQLHIWEQRIKNINKENYPLTLM